MSSARSPGVRLESGRDEAASAALNGASIRPSSQDSLEGMESSFLLFAAYSLIFLGLVWLGSCASLYAFASGYHVNVLYEARWMLATLLISGSLGLALVRSNSSAVAMAFSISLLYTSAAAMTTLLIYALNMARAMATRPSTPLQKAIVSPGRTEYIQLCAVLITLAVLGAVLAMTAWAKLHKLTGLHFGPLRLLSGDRRQLMAAAFIQSVLALFSVYVTSQIISLSFSYIHTYMIQELFCGILLLLVSGAEVLLVWEPSRHRLNLLAFLCLCQFFQELFYSWNAYYISLYIYSSTSTKALGMDYDKMVMTLNFFGHFGRLVLVGLSGWRLLSSGPMRSGAFGATLLTQGKTELAGSARRGIRLLAGALLSLGGLYVLMDVGYALEEHIYRTLFAFTGIAVFYAGVGGLCVALLGRGGGLLWGVLGLVQLTMLGSVSIHAQLVYLQSALSHTVSEQLWQMGRNTRGPALMQFAEALLGLAGMCIWLAGGWMLLRLLREESDRNAGDKAQREVRWLRCLAWALFALTLVETTIVALIKAGWKATDVTLTYSVLDILSTTVLCGLALHLTSAENRRNHYPMMALFCLFLADALTTFNYLSAYTTYVQLLLMLGRMRRAEAFAHYFPVSHLLLLLISHAVQILQWALVVAATVLSARVLEKMSSPASPAHLELRRDAAAQAVYTNAAFARRTEGTEEELTPPEDGMSDSGLGNSRPASVHNPLPERDLQPSSSAAEEEERPLRRALEERENAENQTQEAMGRLAHPLA